jgi:hypothetical protein
MARIKQDEQKKVRAIKLTDKTWADFLNLKNRDDKSWDLFLAELIELLKRIKNL